MGNAGAFSVKRLAVALAFGMVAGAICYLGGLYLVGIEPSAQTFFWIMLNRVLIGFVIGISILRMHWSLHGMLVGLIVGSVFLFYVYITGAGLPLLITIVVMNILFGLMIEFFTSCVFRARVAWPVKT